MLCQSLSGSFETSQGPDYGSSLDSLDSEIEFTREELEELYTRGDIDHAYKSIVASHLSAGGFGRVGECGDLDRQLFVFEEIDAFL